MWSDVRPHGTLCCLPRCPATQNLPGVSSQDVWKYFGQSLSAVLTPVLGSETRLPAHAPCGPVCVSLSDCVFDLCAEEGSAELRCASFETYAAACQEAGFKLGSWRQQLACGKKQNTAALTH